jgi:hypothetical protein
MPMACPIKACIETTMGWSHDDMDCMTLNVELVFTFDEIGYHKTHRCAKMDKGLRVSEGTNHKAIQV